MVVVALGSKVGDGPVQGLGLDDHTRVSAESIVVYLFVVASAVIVQVDDMYLHETLLLGPFDNGVIERTFEQVRHCADNVYSHNGCKFT